MYYGTMIRRLAKGTLNIFIAHCWDIYNGVPKRSYHPAKVNSSVKVSGKTIYCQVGESLHRCRAHTICRLRRRCVVKLQRNYTNKNCAACINIRTRRFEDTAKYKYIVVSSTALPVDVEIFRIAEALPYLVSNV